MISVQNEIGNKSSEWIAVSGHSLFLEEVESHSVMEYTGQRTDLKKMETVQLKAQIEHKVLTNVRTQWHLPIGVKVLGKERWVIRKLLLDIKTLAQEVKAIQIKWLGKGLTVET